MTITIQDSSTSECYADKDSLHDDGGKTHISLRCRHDNIVVERDPGGDGITEPGPGYIVHCPDCENYDLTQNQIEDYIFDFNEDGRDYDLIAKERSLKNG